MQQGDKEWVEQVTGGTVISDERTAQGGSRGTWLVDVERPDGERLDLVLRRDTGDGPFTGTEFSLRREAVVYRALAGTDVAIPRLIAVSPQEDALLVERASGSDDFDSIGDDDQRSQVADSFLRELATLHQVDASQLELPGFARPGTPEEHVLQDLEVWERIYDERVQRPAPIVRFALSWVRRRVPNSVERTVLCWGDVGPGNFLHENGEVTALLDWELAHLGDPMDDLAFFTLRTNLLFNGRFGDLNECLRRYSELTGTKIDVGRIEYYRPLVLVRWLLAALAALDGHKAAQMPGSTYVFLVTFVEKWLSSVLADQVGVTLEPTLLPEPGPQTPRSEVIEMLLADVGEVVMPALSDPAGVTRAMGMTAMLVHLQAADRLGPAVDEAELEDLGTLIGRRPRTVEEGLRALDEQVRKAGPERDAELVRYFLRRADRTAALWPALSSYLGKQIEPLDL